MAAIFFAMVSASWAWDAMLLVGLAMALLATLLYLRTGARRAGPEALDNRPVPGSRLLATLPPPSPELVRLVTDQNQYGPHYHQIDFGSGVIYEGEYDLAPHVDAFDLPAEMSGRCALDVGTADGFFALECAARGATVTAVDVFEYSPVADLARLLELPPVEYRRKSIYDLSPDDGSFDFVVCGSLLLHLTDPIRALAALRSVCGSSLHVSTLSPRHWWQQRSKRCYYVAAENPDEPPAYPTYWSISSSALTSMLRSVGFREISRPRRFTLESLPGRNSMVTPHTAVTAYVESAP
jgi:SAM-dependent methyltransferase